jgi:hypothetical protein
VGAAAATLMPLVDVIRSHVFAAERIHADDTTVTVLAKGKTRIGRLLTYVRDDRPFGNPGPPTAAFFYSRDLAGVSGVLPPSYSELHSSEDANLLTASVRMSRIRPEPRSQPSRS